MRSLFHSLANLAARLSMKLLFACVARVRVVRRENANHDGGFLLVANHISHFDPFILSSVVRRKIDWMAMAEFFPNPLLGSFLRAVDAFPADRHRADRRPQDNPTRRDAGATQLPQQQHGPHDADAQDERDAQDASAIAARQRP